jgi:DNA adenine methylase
MKRLSPLRYPGGKSSFAGLLSEIRRLNGLGHQGIAEPFGGGAGASLSLLFLEEAPKIYINDADPAARVH